ncbi:hypothetical protein [Burkholderia stagnalis]|uniref:hypothetical protein n=1 Tax=Burkholderia stagnalis TaxID=1503054 RepID=UPI000A812DDF
MRSSFAIALCAVVALAGCASTPTPPPEPDMSHLVPVNKTMPSELAGAVVLPVKTPATQWKAGDAK